MSIRGILHTLSLTFIKVRNQKKDDPKILDILILYSDDAQHQIISKYPDKKLRAVRVKCLQNLISLISIRISLLA